MIELKHERLEQPRAVGVEWKQPATFILITVHLVQSETSNYRLFVKVTAEGVKLTATPASSALVLSDL